MIAPDVAMCLNAGAMGRQDAESETLIAHTHLAKGNDSFAADLDSYVAHSLPAEGFDVSEDGTGRGVPLVAGTLKSNSGGGGWSNSADHAAAGYMIPVAYRTSGNDGAYETGNRTDALTTSTAPNSHVLAVFKGGQGSLAGGIGYSEHVAPTLGSADSGSNRVPALLNHSHVRRLTPRECERLQGFPDDYTLIPVRKGMTADGPRYKALGNSMAVPVMRWIGERIAIQIAENRR